MLRYLADLYVNGLIDQEWITGTEEQLKQAYNAGRVAFEYGFGAFSMPGRIGAFMAENGITAEDHAASNESEEAAKAYAARYHEVVGFLDPITVQPGDKVVPACITNTRGGFEDSGLSVSTTVADVDAAMRLLNWVYQPDASGHHTGGWGKQGVGWDFRRRRRRPRAADQGSRLHRRGRVPDDAGRRARIVQRPSTTRWRPWIAAWGTAPSWRPAT